MTLEIAWKATVLLAAAYAATVLLRRRSAAERHTVWTLGLAAVVLLPLLVWLTPAWVPDAGAALFASTVTGPSTTPSGWLSLVPLLWWVGTMVVLFRLGFSHLSMWVWVRRRPVVESAMTWGILRPVILLPEGESRPEVLAHEQAHLARRDGLWRVLAQVACAVYWFHPLAWLAAWRSAQEAEQACDDFVLAGGACPGDYAALLVGEARRLHTAPRAAMPIAAAAGLEQRVRALLDSSANRAPVTQQQWMAAAILAAVLLVPIAALQAPDDEVHKVGGDVSPPSLIHRVEPAYSEDARDARVEGTVVLTIIVTKEGLPEDVKVRVGLHPGLDRNAVDAVQEWRFKPATIKGEPVKVSATVEINFRLR
jgi:TonB family protein